MSEMKQKMDNLARKKLTKEEFKEILDTYAAGVHLPARSAVVNFFLCSVGLIGSGKSTVLNRLAEKLPMAVVSTDAFRKMLKERGRSYDSAHDLAFSAARHFAIKGYNVAIDGNCGRTENKKRIEELAEELKMKAVWIQVSPPEEYILNKLRNFKHTWLFNSGGDAVKSYFEYKSLVEKESVKIDFIYSFDPSRPDFRNQISEAVSVIRAYISK